MASRQKGVFEQEQKGARTTQAKYRTAAMAIRFSFESPRGRSLVSEESYFPALNRSLSRPITWGRVVYSISSRGKRCGWNGPCRRM